MQFDRSDYRESISRKKEQKDIRDMESLLSYMHQAVIGFECLTSNVYWNVYLQILQGWINETETARQAFEKKLHSPEIVNQEQLQVFRHYIFLCNERIETLQAVMKLPQQIIQHEGKVNAEIQKIGEKAET